MCVGIKQTVRMPMHSNFVSTLFFLVTLKALFYGASISALKKGVLIVLNQSALTVRG